jgi:2-polyprenyl-6-methoxyphenol hydroxylase-like FAD-dependent oxidoreductase
MLNRTRLSSPEKPSTGPRRAVVVGGSIGGMLAARVLADHFDQVTVVERDHFPPGSESRPGVPQGRHLHFLLKRGLLTMDRYFPGVRADLLAAGSHQVDQGSDFSILYRSGWSPLKPIGLEMITFTRPLLESIVRRHLAVSPRVRFLEGFEAAGLVGDDAREAQGVRGVRIVPRDRSEGAEAQVLEADLVVDASGRMSQAPQWLQELGYEAPVDSVVDAFWGYATRLYEQPEDFKENWKILLLMNRPPYQPRAGIIQPVEGNRWLVTVAGVMHDFPPTDEEGFLQFAKSLSSSLLYKTIEHARPLTRVAGYRKTENRLRGYHLLKRMPRGFVALGDSVCCTNPVYGLGMTVAGLEAEALDEQLGASHRGRTLDPLKFQKAVAKLTDAPWALATSEDLRWPATKGGEITTKVKVMHWYIEQVFQLIPHNPEVYRRFQEVNHMLKGPEALFHPRVLGPVLRRALLPKAAPTAAPKSARQQRKAPAASTTSTVTLHR